MSNMRILTVSVDVSLLSESEIESLQLAMEVQAEDYTVTILSSDVKDLDIDLLSEEKIH